MSIEDAAAAFDADMGNTRSLSSNDVSRRPPPAEPIFSSLGDLEVDEDSPPVAGGDDDLPPAPKARKRKEDDQDPDDPDFLGFDEDDSDAGEDPDDDADTPDDDQDPDDEDELMSREFSVMVDGEETQVTLKEALRNYSHRQAVDRRMNQVAEGRNAVIQEAQNVIAMRQQVDQQLAEAAEILQALIPQEPNWDELFAKNPAEARNLQKQYEGFQKKVQEIREKREQNQRAAAESDYAETIRYRNTEARKFASMAKWDSAKSRDKDLASMKRTALSLGFSAQEVASVMDSRMLAVLLKASKYDRMMANRPKPVKNIRQQKSDSPGAGRTRTAPKGNDRAMRNLQRTGSIEAAASVFEGILKRSG